MSEGLFRKEALARFMRIDSPGAILSIAPVRTMTIFAVMTALAVALGLFAMFGHSQIVAEGRGIVRPDRPPIVVRAPITGTVLSVKKSRGERASRDEVVVELDTRAEAQALDSCTGSIATEQKELASLEQRLLDWNQTSNKGEATVALVLISQMRAQRERVTALTARCDALSAAVTKSKVSAPVDAMIADVAVSAGAHVQQGDVLATFEPAAANLVGYMRVSETQRSELSVGQKVRLKLDSLPVDEVGAGSAHIARIIDALPSSVKLEPNGEEHVGGVVLEVAIDSMPSNAPVRSGMTFTGDVATRRVRVASLLFGSSNAD